MVDGKVVVMFKNTGNAPQLKQKKLRVLAGALSLAAQPPSSSFRFRFKLSTKVRFQYVQDFLRKQLRFKADEPLFLFINATFQPHPEETVEDLFRCFHDGGKLVVNYCTQAAWG